MVIGIALLGGLFVGVAGTWFVHREELVYLRQELRIAHAQIAHAVIHDRAEIPARVDPVPEPEPLPPELAVLVDEWESAESRIVAEAQIRQWLHEGWGHEAILRQYGASAVDSGE